MGFIGGLRQGCGTIPPRTETLRPLKPKATNRSPNPRKDDLVVCQGSGLRIQGLGLRDLGFGVLGLGLWV